MPRCLVSLGSNQGDRRAALATAVDFLTEIADKNTFRVSKTLETSPIGGRPGQSPYWNAAAVFESHLRPQAIWNELQRIENSLGRTRKERWGERTLDLDLLLYGSEVVRTAELRTPHPRMTFRHFVLQPCCELDHSWIHPECSASLGELLDALRAPEGNLQIVGDEQRRMSSLIAAERPEISIQAEGPHRLTIDARENPFPLSPCGPRLVLADCPRDDWRAEVLAALESVWPSR